jgi:hypothetical protein
MCNMMEYSVLLELEGLADTIVATPEPMPGAGLPYTDVLKRWAATIANGGDSIALATDCVDAFANAYTETSETASLLAVDMAKVPALVASMNFLGKHIISPGCGRPMVDDAVKKAERTSDPDFVYLTDLMVHMRPASTAAQGVVAAEVNAVLSSWERGNVPWGPTVYLPRGPVPGWYKELRVAQTDWGKWVMAYKA